MGRALVTVTQDVFSENVRGVLQAQGYDVPADLEVVAIHPSQAGWELVCTSGRFPEDAEQARIPVFAAVLTTITPAPLEAAPPAPADTTP